MLRKLLRYEFRALLRFLPAFYLALLVVAVAAGVANHNNISGEWTGTGNWMWERGALGEWLMIALGLLTPALFVINLMSVLHRFRDNFLRDEGYLMFTLPVPEWQLAASKGIAALGTFILTGLVWFLSMLVFAFISEFNAMMEQVSGWERLLSRVDPPRVIMGIALVVVGILQQLFLAYAAMTASLAAPRFRWLAGFGVYLAVMIFVESPISQAVHTLAGSWLTPGMLLLQAAFAALYLWGASWLLKHTVNRE
jgi:hypothetical protein